MRDTLSLLRARLTALDPSMAATGHGRFTLGCSEADGVLDGGLRRGALHELFAAGPGDAGATAGFAAALARRAAGARPILWVRQAMAEVETGRLHARGLADLGLDPETLVLLRAGDTASVLRGGGEALRCSSLGAVVLEPWGAPKSLDFTATRRLSLAAGRSGVPCFVLRLAAEPRPSAASTRWRVAAGPSPPLAANAPGRPVFDIALLRQKGGREGGCWHLEWDHESRSFRKAPPLSGAVAALPFRRPVPPAARRLARAG